MVRLTDRPAMSIAVDLGRKATKPTNQPTNQPLSLLTIVMLNIFMFYTEALPGVLGNRGKRVFISGEQRPNFEGNRGTKTILGNREHKKTNFRFLGNRGTSQFISGEQGNRYPPPPPPPWEGLYTATHFFPG